LGQPVRVLLPLSEESGAFSSELPVTFGFTTGTKKCKPSKIYANNLKTL
jgi:hypothetical protein